MPDFHLLSAVDTIFALDWGRKGSSQLLRHSFKLGYCPSLHMSALKCRLWISFLIDCEVPLFARHRQNVVLKNFFCHIRARFRIYAVWWSHFLNKTTAPSMFGSLHAQESSTLFRHVRLRHHGKSQGSIGT